jgi:hypothetical protein
MNSAVHTYCQLSSLILFCVGLMLLSGCSNTFSTEVDSSQKINGSEGNFNGLLTDGDRFGSSLTNLGDLETDGVNDIAVGEPFDDDGGTDRGAVWILFMDDNGQVDLEMKISSNEGNFGGVLDNNDQFGSAVDAIGDINNDGVTDLAVGAPGDDDDGPERGAVWVLFMNNNGTVQNQVKISNNTPGLGNVLADNDQFGSSITSLGDLNNDGVVDLAVGVPLDDTGGQDTGALWILFMNNNGSVLSSRKISVDDGGFAGNLIANDRFAASLDAIGDLNGDGVTDLLVGAPGDDDGGSDRGAAWILFLNSDGTVRDEAKISQTEGEFDGLIGNGDGFGGAVANLGDYNGDGVPELGIAARLSNDGGVDRGAFWVIFPRPDGRVISSSKISDTQGRFGGVLNDGDQFATALVSIGDLDNDGINDIAVSASGDSSNGPNRGALWVLFMAPTQTDVDVNEEVDLETLFGGV